MSPYALVPIIVVVVYALIIFAIYRNAGKPRSTAARISAEIRSDNRRKLNDPRLYTRTAGAGVTPEYRRRA